MTLVLWFEFALGARLRALLGPAVQRVYAGRHQDAAMNSCGQSWLDGLSMAAMWLAPMLGVVLIIWASRR